MHQRSCRGRVRRRQCFLDGVLSVAVQGQLELLDQLLHYLPASDAKFAVANPRYCCYCYSTCAPRLPCLNAQHEYNECDERIFNVGTSFVRGSKAVSPFESGPPFRGPPASFDAFCSKAPKIFLFRVRIPTLAILLSRFLSSFRVTLCADEP